MQPIISQLAACQHRAKEFASRGFVIFPDAVIGPDSLAALRSELERVLLGKSGGPYDSQVLPTKVHFISCGMRFQVLNACDSFLSGHKLNL
jgi:hypothetical protein